MGDFISIWASAIAQFEGFNTAGSRPARNHNPGDLKYAGQVGAVGKDAQGFAIFLDDATGFAALAAQLQLYVSEFPGYSLLQIMAHYLGQPAPEANSQGNSVAYGDYVASALGVDPSTTLAQLVQLANDGSAAPAPGAADVTSTDGSVDLADLTDPTAGLPTTSGAIALAVGGGLLLWALGRYLGW